MNKTSWLMLAVIVLGLLFFLWNPLRDYRRVDKAVGNVLLPVRYNKALRVEIKYVAGDDKKWFTPDDRIYGYYQYELDVENSPKLKECFRGKPDQFHLTHTKELYEYWIYSYDDRGLLSVLSHYTDPGKDKKWYTPDDIEKDFTRMVFDFKGNKIKEIQYKPQDTVTGYMLFHHDARGRVEKDVQYNKPGADREWFTHDDVIEKYHLFDYVENSLICKVGEFEGAGGAGPDGKWFTADDSVTSTKIYFYNPDGSLREDRKYIGAGLDRTWFTGDDELQYYTRYEYAG